MRTIKFRGKNPRSNQWETGNLVVCENGETRIMYAYRPCATVTSTVIPETVGQFTGLKDGEGVEIYEGDIIEGQRYRHLIRCEEKEAAFMAVLLPEYSWVRNDCHISQEWVTEFGKQVIGNVHDNKELVPGNNK